MPFHCDSTRLDFLSTPKIQHRLLNAIPLPPHLERVLRFRLFCVIVLPNLQLFSKQQITYRGTTSYLDEHLGMASQMNPEPNSSQKPSPTMKVSASHDEGKAPRPLVKVSERQS